MVPSGSGKTQLVVDLLTRIYAGSWERIYVFSPSVHLDSVWNVVKDHVRKTGVPADEKCFYDTWARMRWMTFLRPSERLWNTRRVR